MFDKHVAAVMRDARGAKKGALPLEDAYLIPSQADTVGTVKAESMEF
jgi:hypothetical protein